MALTDDLFQSIDTIVSARIANLPYDQTIECEIINADKAEQGIYKVKYQAAFFEVYGAKSSFEVGDHVYVQVPQNDYKQNKTIIAKKKEETGKAVKVLPFRSFAYNETDNLFSYSQTQKKITILTTNDNLESAVNIPVANLLSPLAGYTKLGLKFSVASNIKYNMASGDYGIRLILHGYDQSKISYSEKYALTAPNITHTFEFMLTNSDMIGSNLYNTLGWCNQEKVFDISNLVIDSIQVLAWQNGKFATDQNISVIGRPINFTNFQLYVGYDTSEFKKSQNRGFLYTKDGLLYNSDLLDKKLYIRLLTLKKDTELTTLDMNRYSYIWEQYNASKSTVSANTNKLSFELIASTTENTTNVKLSPSRTNKSQIFLGMGQQNGLLTKIITNELVFQNEAYLENSELLDIVQGFQVSPVEEEKGYRGIFNIYGQDNYTTDQIITEKSHSLLLTYNSVSEDSSDQGFQAGDIITWTIPATYTMLRAPRLGFDYSDSKDITTLSNTSGIIEYYQLTKVLKDSDINTEKNLYIPYYIKEYYTPQNTNNTISFEFVRGADKYTTSIELFFGTSGSQGSEYTVVPYIYVHSNRVRVKAVSLEPEHTENEYYGINFEVYDYNNNLITNITNSTMQFQETKGFEVSSNLDDNGGLLFAPKPDIDLEQYFGCVKIDVEIGGKKIISYFPIPVALSDAYRAINGSTVITYDITGKKPFYNKNKFSIDKNGNLGTITWKLFNTDRADGELNNSFKGWPKIDEDELNLPSIFHTALMNQHILLICKENGNSVWSQPLIIIQNKYPIGLQHAEPNQVSLNDTDKIKNTMVGQISQVQSDGSWDEPSGLLIGVITKENGNDEFGLFSYHNGERLFSINQDGTVALNGCSSNNGIQIINTLIKNSQIENITLKDKIVNEQNTLEINATENLIKADKFIGTATKAQDYDTTSGLINERLELIKTALQTLANRPIPVARVDLNLW